MTQKKMDYSPTAPVSATNVVSGTKQSKDPPFVCYKFGTTVFCVSLKKKRSSSRLFYYRSTRVEMQYSTNSIRDTHAHKQKNLKIAIL